MRIYISHSRAFDYKKELYQPIRNSVLNNEYTFILPHEASNNPYPTKKLFKSGDCQLIIAEVSFPSTGQGIELGWAAYLSIPIIALYKKGLKISGSITAIATNIYEYTNSENLLEKIEEGILLCQK